MIKRSLGLAAVLAGVCTLLPSFGNSPPSTIASELVGGPVHESFNPSDGKIFVLVLGNDARAGNPDASRSDAVHIVGINTDTMRGGILNFPRDAYVPVPGHGTMKLTESLLVGGPELVAKTVEQETGIRLDYWMMTGFEGFQGIVRDLGGVTVTVPRDIFDPGGSGAKLKKGRQLLLAADALAFTRARKVLPGGDLDRTANQARVLLALLRKLRSDVEHDPGLLLKWIAVGEKWTRLDIPPEDIFRLAVLATQVDPGKVRAVTVPVTLGSAGAASVVYVQPSARAIYRRFEKKGSL